MPACPPNVLRISCGAIGHAPAQTHVPLRPLGTKGPSGARDISGPSAACAGLGRSSETPGAGTPVTAPGPE